MKRTWDVPGRAGFTLVELLLTVALFLLLAAAAVFNFDSLIRGAPVEEGAGMMESLFRFTRAHAANSGRTLRIVFERPDSAQLGLGTPVTANVSTNGSRGLENSGATATPPSGAPGSKPSRGIRVMWEADPIGEPGVWSDVSEALSFSERLDELIEIRAVRAIPEMPVTQRPRSENLESEEPGFAEDAADGIPTNAVSEDLAGLDAVPWPAVQFYPDGSSDSVEVWLGAKDSTEGRQLVLALYGVVGTSRRRWVERDSNGALTPASELTTGGNP